MFFFCLFYSISITYLVNLILRKYKILIYSANEKHKEKFNNQILVSGGIIIFLYLLPLVFFNIYKFQNAYIFYFISLIFLVGFLSDFKRISASIRLILISVITLIYLWLSDTYVLDFKFEFINDFLDDYIFVAIVFTLLCFVILINGFNFTDGVHGLTIMYTIILILNLNYFTYFILNKDFHNYEILYLIPILIIIFIYNIKEKIFLGDSGSYFLASIIGLFVVNLTISKSYSYPYVYGCLLIYPAFEVFFSILRKIINKGNPLEADKKHLHHLLQNYIQYKFKYKLSLAKILSGLSINLFIFIFCFICIHLYENKYLLLLGILTFCIIYLISYYIIKKQNKIFKV